MERAALAELSREQLIELVLALAAEVAKLKVREGAGELVGAAFGGFKANRAECRAQAAARAPSGLGGTFMDNQDVLLPPLEVGADCYADFSSFLYSRMSPG